MKTFTLDLHHVVLYGLLAVVSFGALGVLHSWRVDVSAAKVKSAADEKIIQEADRQKDAAAQQYQAQLKFLQNLRVTPKTPPADLLKRLQGLEPEMSILPDQLVAPKPDAPKANLVLNPEQLARLDNRLIDCKECEAERSKLRTDVTVEKTKRAAVEDQRDEWKKAAQGGSLWTRFKRRMRAFGEDAVVIELIRCAAGHC
jgi:hypothetical protein